MDGICDSAVDLGLISLTHVNIIITINTQGIDYNYDILLVHTIDLL